MSHTDVLIVEDDPNLKDALRDTLEFAGYSVTAVEHGQAALARLDQHSYGMVISDVQMQPVDGMELLEKIRRDDQQMPVVMMTAYGTIEKAVDAMRLGASDYLVKPFEAEALIELTKRLLPKQEAHHPADDNLVAVEDKMQSLKALASKVAQSDATGLMGVYGVTGQRVFAQFIH